MLTPEFWRNLDEVVWGTNARDRMHWEWDNSGLPDYLRRFGHRPQEFGADLMRRLERVEASERVALDLAGGSKGLAVMDLIKWGYVTSGLTADHQAYGAHTSVQPNSHLIDADLTTEIGWQKILDWKNRHIPEGFALILHRPGDALQYLPTDSYSGFLQLSVDLLAPRGIMIAQIPEVLRPNDYDPHVPAREKLEACLRRNPDIGRFEVNNFEPHLMPWIMLEKAFFPRLPRV